MADAPKWEETQAVAPSWDNTQDLAAQPSPSQLESAVRGAAQGATLGHADELAGLLESLTSDKSYEQSRDESRAAYKAAQEANPWTYGLSEVGGGLLIPGFGEASAGAKGLAKAGQLALKGGVMGAIAGEGSSEGKTGKDIAKDTAQGAILGGILNPIAGQVVPGVAKTGKDLAENLQVVKNMKDIAKRAYEGNSLAGQGALAKATNTLRDTIENQLFPFVGKDANDIVSDAYDATFDQARKSGKTVDISTLIQNTEKALTDRGIEPADANKIMSTLKRFAGAEDQVVGFKQINPMTRNPEEMAILDQNEKLANKLQSQKNALQAKQDIKLSKMQDAGVELPEGLNPELNQVQGPAFDSDLLKASAAPGVSPDYAQLKTPNMSPVVGKGEYSAIKPISEEVLTTPQQSIDQLKTLKDVIGDYVNPATSSGRAAMDLQQKIDNLISSNVDPNSYAWAKEMRSILSDARGKLGLADIDFGKSDSSRQSLANKVDAYANQLVEGYGTAKGVPDRLRFEEGMQQMAKIDPAKAAQIQGQAQEQAKDLYLSRQLNEPKVGGNSLAKVLTGGTTGFTYHSADQVGKAARAISEWQPTQIASLIPTMAAKGYDKYAKMLTQASMAEPSKRQALLFVLAQDPGFREAAGSTVGLGDGGE